MQIVSLALKQNIQQRQQQHVIYSVPGPVGPQTPKTTQVLIITVKENNVFFIIKIVQS